MAKRARSESPPIGNWVPGFALPNIRVRTPIEAGLAALVPHDDARVARLRGQHRTFGRYLAKFTDPFGRRIRPAVLLMQEEAPPRFFEIGAIASLRDAIAIATVARGQAMIAIHQRSGWMAFSDWFAFYPWAMAKDYTGLINQTPAILGWDEVTTFRGQSSPELSPHDLDMRDVDEPLLRELLRRWERFHRAAKPLHEDTVLFRSLNMANQAARMPAGVDATNYDSGRSVALWVSAFEILAHPPAGDTGFRQVYELLEKVAWKNKRCRLRRYRPYWSRDPAKTQPHKILACWVYGELHQARNAFLHGKPVDDSTLRVRLGRYLTNYPAVLYRMALTGFLDLSWRGVMPPAEFSSDKFDFEAHQRDCERALATIKDPLPEHVLKHRRMLAKAARERRKASGP